MTVAAGIVASGHECTSRAGCDVLAAGGNAFDAALGALCAATVAEPLLASLGGGGFLLAKPSGGDPVVFDFFVNTPQRRRPSADIDFHPILANFGTASQEFHIGLGSMAVPGVVAGLFAVNEALGRLPMPDIVAPAVMLARQGVPVNRGQAEISRILAPMLARTPAAMALVAHQGAPDLPAPVGMVCRNPDLGDTLERLAEGGPNELYRGDLARQLAADCGDLGGQLTLDDLAGYRVQRRLPVTAQACGARVWLNAPPSPGGSLVAHALACLDSTGAGPAGWGSAGHALAVAEAQAEANRRRLADPALFSRGTTHLSVVDGDGNLAALTVSNGEGCGYVLPGTGILMNNMLGEEDLNPGGFHRWPEGSRLASMMCPTVARLADGTEIALGSGGANRIRGAVLQVLNNVAGFGLPLVEAVAAPRMHLEGERLSIECSRSGDLAWSEDAIRQLGGRWPDLEAWPEANLFFGGVHAVTRAPDGRLDAAGDFRRDGAVARYP